MIVMKLRENATGQKLRGAYYTPVSLAAHIVRLFGCCNRKRILEPSCGDGAFLDALFENCESMADSAITAVEIEPEEASKVSEKYKGKDNVFVDQSDFFSFYERNKKKRYDLIIGNPPYIRYQYLLPEQRSLLSEIVVSHGMRANKLINAWVGFMVACAELLEDDGIMAFVVPAELLQVGYAQDLRLFLANCFSRITLLTFEKLLFEEAEQEVVVFIGEKGIGQSLIRIVQCDTVDDLDALDLEAVEYQPLSHVREKWTKYFLSEKEARLIKSLRSDDRLCRFGDIALINIGITTGDNKFFSMTEEIASEYELRDYTLPLVGRSAHALGLFFSEDDWIENLSKGKRSRLLALEPGQSDSLTLKQRGYLELGESQGVRNGYKCSIRDYWYSVPSVWVPDAFFFRRNNLYPRLILNTCHAVSTDTMHRVKFNEGVDHELAVLLYYNSISLAFTEICGRSYGGGVLEVLPTEASDVMMPNPKIVRLDFRIDDLLAQVDAYIRFEDGIEKALDLVDRSILIERLGFSVECCESCRRIWKSMQSRRLNRGRDH